MVHCTRLILIAGATLTLQPVLPAQAQADEMWQLAQHCLAAEAEAAAAEAAEAEAEAAVAAAAAEAEAAAAAGAYYEAHVDSSPALGRSSASWPRSSGGGNSSSSSRQGGDWLGAMYDSRARRYARDSAPLPELDRPGAGLAGGSPRLPPLPSGISLPHPAIRRLSIELREPRTPPIPVQRSLSTGGPLGSSPPVPQLHTIERAMQRLEAQRASMGGDGSHSLPASLHLSSGQPLSARCGCHSSAGLARGAKLERAVQRSSSEPRSSSRSGASSRPGGAEEEDRRAEHAEHLVASSPALQLFYGNAERRRSAPRGVTSLPF